MEYRAYTVNYDGHLNPPRVLECADDGEAIAQVKVSLNGQPIELWQGTRLVGWCERIDDTAIVLSPEQKQS